jgi:esterase
VQLYFQAHGQGEPLVILHGLFGSSDNWGSISPKLADYFHVFAVDLRNHGRSGHDPQMSFSLMAEDLGELLRGQQLDHANVLGHSLGGKVAMQFGCSFPQRVKRLIIVDIAPRPYPPNHRPILTALMGLDLGAYTTRKEIEDALAPDIPDLSLRRFLLKNLARDSDGRFQWRMGLAEINQNYDRLCEGLHAAAPYRGPALFIRGESSAYLTPGDLPELQRLFSRAELKAIPRSEHLVHVENPSAFLEVTLEFLRAPPGGVD